MHHKLKCETVQGKKSILQRSTPELIFSLPVYSVILLFVLSKNEMYSTLKGEGCVIILTSKLFHSQHLISKGRLSCALQISI